MLATLKARLNCIRARLADSTTAEQPETETVEWTNEKRLPCSRGFLLRSGRTSMTDRHANWRFDG